MSLEPHPRPPRPPGSRSRRTAVAIAIALLAVVPLAVTVPVAAVAGASWVAARGIVRRRRRAELAAALADPAQITLGEDGAGRTLSLHSTQLSAHGLIVGASGSGKTTTLLSIATQQIRAGHAVVAIDLKGSREFAADLDRAARESGRRLRLWTPEGPERWNPLAHGNPTELKDRLISTERFSEPHYRRAAERYAQIACGVLAECHPGRPPELAEVVDLLDPARLLTLARELPSSRAERVAGYVRGLGPDQVSAVRGLGSRLAVITESATGPFLAGGPGSLDLEAALAAREVVLFSLNASSLGSLSPQLGALVIQDLVSVAGSRERAPAGGQPPASIVIDEFSALGADHVMALIARGRSAGMSVLLATQELADLDRVGRGFRQQVVGSTAVKIAHRQDSAASAEEIARLSGTEPVWETSLSQPGDLDGWGAVAAVGSGARVSHRLVRRPRVDPTVVQSLETGEAVVITKLPRSETRLTRIRPLGLGRQPEAPAHGSER